MKLFRENFLGSVRPSLFETFPVNVWALLVDTFVVWVSLLSLRKWLVICNPCEKADSSCEEVGILSEVRLLLVDFWSHVSWSSEEFARLTLSDVVSKSEIGDFKIVLSVNEKVLGLDVPVGDLVLVAMRKAFKQLLEEVSGQRLAHGSIDS